MSVVSVDKDYNELSIIVVADFDAPLDRVWQLFADPRQLERWWGPPGYPATVEEHDLRPGGRVRYFMTSPEGEKHHGLWEVVAVEPPTGLQARDFFADVDGNPVADMPSSSIQLRLFEHAGKTRMEMRSFYETQEDLDQVIEMGALEGIRLAVGQIDELLAAEAGR